ncbi:hypothetical protein [Nonomuraea sp. NPDC049784]
MKRVPISDGLQNDAHPTDDGHATMGDRLVQHVAQPGRGVSTA